MLLYISQVGRHKNQFRAVFIVGLPLQIFSLWAGGLKVALKVVFETCKMNASTNNRNDNTKM